MTGLVDTVRGKVPSTCLVVGRLKKEGCSVSLKDAPRRRLIVDFDKSGSPLGANDTRCDYLLVAEERGSTAWVAPIEIKRGRLDASEAVEQLRAGARVAEQLVPSPMRVDFRPVAASGGNKAERAELRNRQNMIRFHGQTEYVRFLNCGERLIDAFTE